MEDHAPSGKHQLGPPLDFVTAARACMGGIDLDPYSSRTLNRLVTAKRIIERDAGLEVITSQEWGSPGKGRVLMMPPTGSMPTRRLMGKLLREYRHGRVEQACVLITYTETLARLPWVWDFPICVPFSRLKPCYWDDELRRFFTISPSSWSVVLYLPPISDGGKFHSHMTLFHAAFARLGRIVYNEYAGEDDWRDCYAAKRGKPYADMA